MNIPVYATDGRQEKEVELPPIFSYPVKIELIRRATTAEHSYNLQPQGHFLLAGMQTSAKYYGAMNEYRSGRHMGIAIRPREKLGGGRQGKVKRIPSAVKGKRAHPHMVEKKIFENMNKREYQNAIMSSISATARQHIPELPKNPIVVKNDIESAKKTKDMVKIFESLKLGKFLDEGKIKRTDKGLRRSTKQRRFKKLLLLVVNSDKGAVKAARNIAGVDACTIKDLTASAFAPGGNSTRVVVWSEDAVKNVESAVKTFSLTEQSKYYKA